MEIKSCEECPARFVCPDNVGFMVVDFDSKECKTVRNTIIELSKSELDRLKQENEKLQQQNSKLIEALKTFSNIGDAITTLQGTAPTSFEMIESVFIKASQTMKEVCGD
jgi:uncharacterized protein YigA (DUF484 family)